MSWLLEGEMRETPGVAWRAAAILAVTLKPGRCPPSPGLAPCPTLISRKSAELRNAMFTPKRPEAICCPRFFRYRPSMSAISPPSPFMQTMLSRLAASA
jgi:hypothetical protein